MTPTEERKLIAEIDAKYPIGDPTCAAGYRAPAEAEVKTHRPARKARRERSDLISRDDVASMITDAILAERKHVLYAIVKIVSDPIGSVEAKLAGFETMLDRLQRTLSAPHDARSASDYVNIN